MINSENITNRPAFQYKKTSGMLTTEFYGKVSRKLVRAGSLLRGTLAIRKANLVEKKKIREGQKRDRFENRLESNPNVEKNKNFVNRIPRPESGVGILGWFKNFIGSVALGFFATKLIGNLPLFEGILKGVLGVANFVASTGMVLVNAISSFINVGYKAYDSTAGFLKSIGGDNAIKLFDDFTNRLSTLLDVLVIATVLRGTPGGAFGPVLGQRQRGRGTVQKKKKTEKIDISDKRRQRKPRVKGGGGLGRLTKVLGAAGLSALGVEGILGESLDTKAADPVIRKQTARKQRDLRKRRLKKERTKIARAERVKRQNALLDSPAGRRALDLNRFLGKEGLTNDPEFRIFKRVNRLDRAIEKNQIAGDRLAARRNLAERKKLIEKLEKGQTIKGRTTTGIQPRRRVRTALDIVPDDLRRAATPTSKVKGVRLKGNPLMKVLRNKGLRLPVIGAIVDFGLAILEGDSIPKAASRSIFAGIGGAAGSFLGLIGGPFAPILSVVGALLGGALGDALGGFIYDTVLKGYFPQPSETAGAKVNNFIDKLTGKAGELFNAIYGFLFGQRALQKKQGLIPYGGFEEDRPGYKKPDGTITKPQPQFEPRPGSKGMPLPPRKSPMGGKVNFSSLFDLITSGEGGLDSVNYGTTGSASTGKKELGKSLTEMTIDEVHAQQHPNGIGLGAVGKYQIIPTTMKGFIRYLRAQGIDTSKRKFDASIQNMYGQYSITQKRAKVGRFLKGDTGVSLDTAQLELAAEYASVGVPYDMKKGSYNGKYPVRDIKKGESLYSGIGGNRASSAHTDEVRSMLQKLREQASYEKSDSTVIINSSDIASNNITPVPIKDKTLNIASNNQSNYDPFHITYSMG